MIFAYAGNDLIVTEEDYVSMFIDSDSEQDSVAQHPLKKFRFTKPCDDLSSPFTFHDSLKSKSNTSERVFRLVKMVANGRYLETLVICEECDPFESTNRLLCVSETLPSVASNIDLDSLSSLSSTQTRTSMSTPCLSLPEPGLEVESVDMDLLMRQWTNIDDFTNVGF